MHPQKSIRELKLLHIKKQIGFQNDPNDKKVLWFLTKILIKRRKELGDREKRVPNPNTNPQHSTKLYKLVLKIDMVKMEKNIE